MHRVSIELELENRPLLLRALPYLLPDNEKSVHLYVYSGDRDTVEEIKTKAEMKYFNFNALIECTDLAVTPFKAPPINFPEIVKKLNSKTIEQINNDIEKNLGVFSSHRNVTAIMAGQKISKSCHTNQPCITVYVMGKGRIPFGETELPEHVGDFAIDVVEGFVTELSSRNDHELYYTVSRPLKLGVSVGVKGRKSAGTLGAIVKDENNNMYALSCEHVFNPDPVGENSGIEQPALTDYVQYIKYFTEQMKEQEQPEYELYYRMKKLKHVLNSPPQTIGSYRTGVRENVSFNDYTYFVDAALVQLSEEQSRLINEGVEVKLCENKHTSEVHSSQGIIGREVKVQSTNGSYKPLAKLSEDIELHKCGRTTGLTVKGEMIYEKIYKSETLPPENERFSHRDIKNSWHYNCMIIKSGDGNLFSDNGDSGSLVLDNEGNAWALIFAKFRSAHDNWRSIACPIEVVLKKLGSEIDSELTIVSKNRS